AYVGLIDLADELQRFDPPLNDVLAFAAILAGDADEFAPDAQRGRAALGQFARPALDAAHAGSYHGVAAPIALDDRLDLVGATDEIRDKAVVGIEIDFLGRAFFDDAPGAHDGDCVRQRQRLDPVMR